MQPADRDNLTRQQFTASHGETNPRTDARLRWHHDLDWADRLAVEAQEPRRGSAGEDSLSRERALPCRKQLPGILFYLRKPEHPGAEPSPSLPVLHPPPDPHPP